MKHNLLTRISFTVLIVLLALSLSGWTGQAALIQAAAADGSWTGTTNRDYPVSFTVSGSGTTWSSFRLKTDFSLGGCTGTVEVSFTQPGAIINNQFGRSTTAFSFTGQFTGQGTASGTYTFSNMFISGCGASFSQSGTWTASVPLPTFSDVPFAYWAHDWIERLYNADITGGCGSNPLIYCPEATVTRAQMAVFLLRGIHNAAYNPPSAGSSTGFSDVPLAYWAASWIKQLAAEGITGGCGGGKYCPESPVTRAEMAVFLLRSKHGASYTPPAAGSTTGFTDVPTTHWAAAWIKQLVAEGIATGCGTSTYCPEAPVTRAQMAVFLVRTFELP